jgi:hypothetical protein
VLSPDASDLVIEGTPRVVNAWVWGPGEPGEPYTKMLRYTFIVSRTVKGPSLNEVVIDSYTNDCGIQFKLGKLYRIVAYSLPDVGILWATDQCTETKQIAFESGRPTTQ